MTNIDRAAEVVAREYATPDLWKSTVDPSVLIAQALADATPPLLMPDPQIIRTVEELEALDQETIVQRRAQYPGQYSRTETAGDLAYVVRRWGTTTHLPAAVVTPAAQVRVARKALEEA